MIGRELLLLAVSVLSVTQCGTTVRLTPATSPPRTRPRGGRVGTPSGRSARLAAIATGTGWPHWLAADRNLAKTQLRQLKSDQTRSESELPQWTLMLEPWNE
jgi:hypothetical protein